MRTQWGKLMATLSEGGDDETPLQVKLNGVQTIIGLFSRKTARRDHTGAGMEMMQCNCWSVFAVAVTIVVVAVPEGLPLAVTLSLAFAMKKMNE
ncbi:hypothetical protein M0R45_004674 [Rubus argutus]|uniref:Uncharacterized protein n=1 Tax=Rubus argutus TaxID=59490 RepID=A0AAW1YKJ5_RUBAR